LETLLPIDLQATLFQPIELPALAVWTQLFTLPIEKRLRSKVILIFLNYNEIAN